MIFHVRPKGFLNLLGPHSIILSFNHSIILIKKGIKLLALSLRIAL
jgi:hypothetical protein